MINLVIPMAGAGSRFSTSPYTLPKPLININGYPMIVRAISSLAMPPEVNWHFVIRRDKFSNEIREVISRTTKAPRFIEVDEITAGPACSALLFKDSINNDEELIVANCDQIMEWDSELFFHNVRLYDAAVVTYFNTTPKNSYARIDKKGRVIEIREKQVISNISLNGIHYWRHGKFFVTSTETMISDNDRASNGEFYIAPTYNYLLREGKHVGIFHIPNEQHHAVGTPEDLEIFLSYEKAKFK
jgi:NDP-sugar pyrophosphorylase family protein